MPRARLITMNRRTLIILAVALALLLVIAGIARYRGGVTGTTTSVPDITTPSDGWQPYASAAYSFSIRRPDGFVVDEAYAYQGLRPDESIPGVSFTIPAAMTSGTNLSKDTRVSVERLPAGTACDAVSFIGSSAGPSQSVRESGRDWTVAKGGDAGAGNFYDETVYATSGPGGCYGLRLFIHSTNVGNYDPGAVVEFDREALDATYAQFRASFTATQ